MALWKVETCRCYARLIIFYIIKVVLDYKIMYSINDNFDVALDFPRKYFIIVYRTMVM